MAELSAAQRKWRVSEWMSPIAVSIRPEMRLTSAFCKMLIEEIRHLPVIDHGKLLGIISDRDLRSAHVTDSDDWRDLFDIEDHRQVKEVMTTEVVTVRPEDPLEKALELLIAHKIGALPVIGDRGVVEGMLSVHDMLRALDESLAEIRLAWA